MARIIVSPMPPEAGALLMTVLPRAGKPKVDITLDDDDHWYFENARLTGYC
jgi:hypothetical protein